MKADVTSYVKSSILGSQHIEMNDYGLVPGIRKSRSAELYALYTGGSPVDDRRA